MARLPGAGRAVRRCPGWVARPGQGPRSGRFPALGCFGKQSPKRPGVGSVARKAVTLLAGGVGVSGRVAPSGKKIVL